MPAPAPASAPPPLAARVRLAVTAGNVVAALSAALRLGAGTSLPGKVARRIAPGVLQALSAQIPGAAIAVTGANGKTTTCGLLAQFLRESGLRVAHNQLGANMIAGITAALARQTSANGRLDVDAAVLEVDEASLRGVVKEVAIDRIVVNNLFRDQLDRYGELDATARLIREGVAGSLAAQPGGRLYLNADDPLVFALSRAFEGPAPRIVSFGVENVTYAHPAAVESDAPFPTEATPCAHCGAPVQYESFIYGHLGRYACPTCGHFKRPQPDVTVETAHVSPDGSDVTIRAPQWLSAPLSLRLPTPGLFNVYNLLAAVTVALDAGASAQAIERGVSAYQGVFGRAERKTIRGRDVRVFLIKNPVGATEVLRLTAGDPAGRLLIALNDDYADGRDVSWIWDAGFEALAGHSRPIVVSGRRAEDMAVRLKYVGLPSESIVVEPDLRAAVREAVNAVQPGETLYILPTYTALLALRNIL